MSQKYIFNFSKSSASMKKKISAISSFEILNGSIMVHIQFAKKKQTMDLKEIMQLNLECTNKNVTQKLNNIILLNKLHSERSFDRQSLICSVCGINNVECVDSDGKTGCIDCLISTSEHLTQIALPKLSSDNFKTEPLTANQPQEFDLPRFSQLDFDLSQDRLISEENKENIDFSQLFKTKSEIDSFSREILKDLETNLDETIPNNQMQSEFCKPLKRKRRPAPETSSSVKKALKLFSSSSQTPLMEEFQLKPRKLIFYFVF
jgi:hypothetical protein